MQIWDISRTTYKVSDFLSWQKNSTLVLSPSFQRRPVWQPGAKSFLVDTVVRGLPMPIIFLRELPSDLKSFEPKREVVDGQQRIRTLISYIAPRLLKNYEESRDAFTVRRNHNKELANKRFSELSPDYQQRLLDYQFSVHVFPSDTDDREILQIFARMNSTGVKLNAQELRNANYFGEFKTLMYTLASEQLPQWRKWKIFTEYNIARMEEVEMTSEFALFMQKGITGKTQNSLDSVYKEFDETFPHSNEIAKRFRYVMESIGDKMGDKLAFLPYSNKTLFYVLFAAFYDCHYGNKSSLTAKRPQPLSTEQLAWFKTAGERILNNSAPTHVLESAARRTTHVSSRNELFNYLRKNQ